MEFGLPRDELGKMRDKGKPRRPRIPQDVAQRLGCDVFGMRREPRNEMPDQAIHGQRSIDIEPG
jgi:hypothetical protein